MSRIAARRAGEHDVEALVRLRAQMLGDMGTPTDGPAWRAAARDWFIRELRRPERFAVFVVDDPYAGVVSCAAGKCEARAPSPGNVGGAHGRVFNMSTAPRHRRRGCAAVCLGALLDWFQEETDARVLDLNATEDGIGLYRSLGFDAPRHPALQLDLRV